MKSHWLRAIAACCCIMVTLVVDANAVCWECSISGSCVSVGPPKVGMSGCYTPEIGVCILTGHTCTPFFVEEVTADGYAIGRSGFGAKRSLTANPFHLASIELGDGLDRTCKGIIVGRGRSTNSPQTSLELIRL